MPKWWPWGRTSTPTTATVTSPPRTEPSWHRLPAIQRTVDGLETTAPLDKFNASLTTANSPLLTGQVDVLSAVHPEQLPVLDSVRESVAASVPPQSGTSTPAAPAARQWGHRLSTAQRAIAASAPVVQRSADNVTPDAHDGADGIVDAPRELYPVPEFISPEPQHHSFTAAPQPSDARILEAAPTPSPSVPLTGGPLDHAPTDPDTGGNAVTVFGAEDHPAVAATESPTPPSAPTPLDSAAHHISGPLRHLPSVQRAATGHDSAPAHIAAAPALPVVSRSDRHVAPQSPGHPTADASPTADRRVQRAPVIATDSPRATTTPAALPIPAQRPASQPATPATESHHHLPVLRTTDVQGADVQRFTSPTGEREPGRADRSRGVDMLQAPSAPSRPTRVAQRSQASEARRLPVVDGPVSLPAPVSADDGRGPAAVQRSTIGSQSEPAVGTPDSGRTTASRGGDSPAGTPLSTADEASFDSDVVEPLHPPATLPTVTPTSVEPAVAQRSTVSAGPVAQRTPGGGRLVVLPPLRNNDGSDNPAAPSHTAQRSVLSESPRPMSLQRMFEHTARFVDSDGDTVAAADGHPVVSGAGNPITASGQSVQREPESSSPAPESAPAPATSPAPAAAAAPPTATAGAPTDVEELVNKLYDPLAARLRAELWLDRERAGALMDLRR